MKRTLLWFSLFLTIAAILAAFGLRSFDKPRTPSERKPVSLSLSKGERPLAPSFTLTDQTGRPFTSESLRGKPWVADFIFTSCAGSCPLMSERMAGLQHRLPARVLLVSFSVDPKRDTPPVLAEYAKRHGAQPGRWFFLTGTEKEIARIVQQGFKLSYAEGTDPREPVTHSVRFVLVDRSGAIRGYYDSTDPEALRRLEEDAHER